MGNTLDNHPDTSCVQNNTVEQIIMCWNILGDTFDICLNTICVQYDTVEHIEMYWNILGHTLDNGRSPEGYLLAFLICALRSQLFQQGKAHLVLGTLSTRLYWYCSKVHVDISVL